MKKAINRILKFGSRLIFLGSIFCVIFHVNSRSLASAETSSITTKPVKVGIATPLSGDFAVLGDNLAKTVETYKKKLLRHKIEFVFEDAKIGGSDGLRAYKKLIEVDHVDFLVGGTTSNGTMAGAPIINKSKTVLITPLTGGSNIDQAGQYIFRIGNSDILNGQQQADLFIEKGLTKVGIFTEQTEYTQDIAKHFRERFLKRGGQLVYDQDFLPASQSFKSEITKLRMLKPQALFMSTQSGSAFGVFIKEFRQLVPDKNIEIHTNFVASSNPDAFKIAADAMHGIYYMAPLYDQANPRLLEFLDWYKEDHGQEPAIAFHTAGLVDSLNMLQDYLDQNQNYDREGFKDYLLKNIKNYHGLMGNYSFDSEGNANIGFGVAQIK